MSLVGLVLVALAILVAIKVAGFVIRLAMIGLVIAGLWIAFGSMLSGH